MQLKVVSQKYEEISRAIQRQADRGTTLLKSVGGYGGQEGCTVLTVVSNRELAKLTETVTEIDPDAFMVVSQVNEVRGRGFTLPKRYGNRRKMRRQPKTRGTQPGCPLFFALGCHRTGRVSPGPRPAPSSPESPP